ncbi:glucuronate isomerase [Saonia flava]|uniref:Uronate isomerase n=1 Tax=Saonia flava TaxID=523696 RepID=A0A846R4E0_9FLAO|nr:glucuronate isomerase [Saonia flava]NJB72234.1 glucuronate isomerase [Saonia flava]
MKNIINSDFLLDNKYSKILYRDYAEDQPIIDYHCHLPPDEIANNRAFGNMTKLWIDGDHYKWRAMRNLGIAEKHITGNSSDEVKFNKWAETVPYTMRNPLYHWTHLELKRYFDIDESLTVDSASKIYGHCNEKLKQPEFHAQGLIKRMNVKVVCTTDDPIDSLAHHRKIKELDMGVNVLPTFRPDNIVQIDKIDFTDYLSTLSSISTIEITDLESLKAAIKSRVTYFHSMGCRLSDHGLPHAYGLDFSEVEVNNILKNRLKENPVSEIDALKYKSAIMCYLGSLYAEHKWVMQLHLGSIRDTNKALLEKIGINAGVDSIGDYKQAEQLASFLNKLNNSGNLPKTVLYNSNPADNEVFATMAGNFSEEDIKGKVQYGASWWFLDQKDGITKQLDALSNMGLLSCALGMLTDSRSFLSFPRHEYYRRILCNILGNDIKNGELPNDIKWIGKLVQDICYNNANEYFEFSNLVKKTPIS